jgi:predicted transcriptional regulator
MPVGNRRNELEIIRDILGMNSGRTTLLRHSVNLSHAQMRRYLDFLERAGLITLERQGSRTLMFQVTEKGQAALDQINLLFDLLGLDSLGEVGS